MEGEAGQGRKQREEGPTLCAHLVRCETGQAGAGSLAPTTSSSRSSFPAPAQVSAMSSPLPSLLLLALNLRLAGALDANDPNTCSFWER